MKIGIIIAMDIEYRNMCEALGGKSQGYVNGNEVVLWQCGIGKVNAAVGTMRLIEQHHPDCIISTGLAGGIDNRLQVMDVVIGSQTAYHDVWCGEGNELGQVQGLPTRFDADGRLLICAQTASEVGGHQTVCGLICTGDQFITDRERQHVIKRNFPDGKACDMESAAIAQTCFLLKVPFLSLRIISDTPGRTDDHRQQWEDFLNSMCDRSFQFVKNYLESL